MSRAIVVLACLAAGCAQSALPAMTDLGGGAADMAAGDLAAPDLAAADLSRGIDGIGGFAEQLAGVWLLGWSGGLDHYSWVRFSGTSDALDLQVPMGNSSWTALWSCSGRGSYSVTARPNTVLLRLPAGCAVASQSITFLAFTKPVWPAEALLEAALETGSMPPLMNGWKFPDDQCDAGFGACRLPR